MRRLLQLLLLTVATLVSMPVMAQLGPGNITPPIGTATIPPTYSTAGASQSNYALDVTLSPNSSLPFIVQKVTTTGTGSQASLQSAAFTGTAGNSLIVICGVGNNGAITVTDTLGHVYTQDVNSANGATFSTATFRVNNIKGGSNQVTVTPSASVSIAFEIYEVAGIVAPGGSTQMAVLDASSTGNGSSTSPASGAGTPVLPYEISFSSIAIGTANQTPTAFAPWSKDADMVIGGTPAGIFGLHSFSMGLGQPTAISLSATITSEPWAASMVTYKGYTVPVVAFIPGDVQAVGDASDNGAAAIADRIQTLPGIYQTTPGNGTVPTQGRDAALPVGLDVPWTGWIPSRTPPSYYASTGATGVTVAASATDIFEITGNATTDVLVTSLKVSCTQTTGGTLASTFQVLRRSTADGAASTNLTKGQDDTGTSASSIAAAGVGVYTANPSLGTTDSNIDSYAIGCPAPATIGPNDIYILNRRQKPIVLQGTTQQLVVNLNGKTVTGGIFYISVEWIEEKHIAITGP